MVKVHVWLQDAEHIGHTALSVNNAYVSFWPDGEAGKKDLKIKRSQPGQFMASLHDDIYNEGDRHPITIELSQLDTERMLDFIAQVQNNIPRYQLARNNCSHVVANALIAGSTYKPSFIPHAGHYSKIGHILGVGIWTPDQVLRYARELRRKEISK